MSNEKFIKKSNFRIKLVEDPSPAFPYTKADYFQAGRVGPDFVVTSYQLNYQYLVSKATSGETTFEEGGLIPVNRIVMNEESFMRLRKELDDLFQKWQLQISKEKQ